MDTTALEAAYRSLLEIAGAGGFRPPADSGDWTAEQHLAHVAATDRLLAAATVEVLGGRPARYDNTPATSLGYLATIGRAAGDHERLVATVRQTGLELVLLARQLDDERGKTPVPTKIVDGGVVKVDAPLPWVATLKTHAEVHLPDHIEALRRLRQDPAPPKTG
jgi:hypothetical protein